MSELSTDPGGRDPRGEPIVTPSPAGPDGDVADGAAPVSRATATVRPPRRAARAFLAGAVGGLLLVVAFSAGVLVGRIAPAAGGPLATPAPSAPGEEAAIALVEEAWRQVLANYVDAANLDPTELAYGAIRGLIEAVGDDGHTSFLTAEEVAAQEQSLSGTFVGIGVQVTREEDAPVVSSVIPRTPAEEAGLRRGDRILEVDGRPTAAESLDETVARVRGPEGTTVTLLIRRTGVADFEIEIVRRRFDLPLVAWTMVPGRTIAYIRLDQFATGATDAVEEALRGAAREGATAIVLDLRGNPGGYVSEAVGVASQFLADGIVYRSFDRSGEREDAPVEPGGLATAIPVVVLADAATASSAEIVTGALQDAGRATVVGMKTFGTGTVLGRFDLADGSSLRIGIERWQTRDGRAIWLEGLDPDVVVELPAEVAPVLPDDLREMTEAEVAGIGDLQLLRALELLADEG